MIAGSLRARLLGGVVLVLTPLAAAAQAAPQDGSAEPSPAQATAPASAPASVPAEAQPQDIVVTGSRIRRPEYEAANPITSFNTADIQRSGNTNVTNFLQRVPALTGSLDSTQTAGYDAQARTPFGGAGLNELNLRNLGTARTLVLVNGRRHVAAEPSTAAVDISTIPTDLIERVDVLTGGASAVYGADGVSGVVNFVLKRDFDGVSARVQSGISQYGDGGNRFASAIAGRNFADGRANLTLAYEYNADDRVETEDRSFLRNGRRRYLITNPAGGKPTNALLGDLRYDGESPYGAVDVNGDFLADFRGDGQVYNRQYLVGGYAQGGDSTQLANYTGDLLPQIRRHTVNLLGHFDASDAFKLSVEGKFASVHATTFYQYGGNYPATLSIDNPYMPDSIRRAAIAAGQTTVSSVRDNFDLGRRGEDDLRKVWRGVVAATGRITSHATYDVSVVYGQTDVTITKLNDRYGDRFAAALDVVRDPRTGLPTCRSNIDTSAAAALGATTFTPGPNSGCVPLNTFGLYTATPQAIAFFRADHSSPARLTQTVATASISGDFGALFELPGGPVQFAVGGEYRRETSRFDPNDLLRNNLLFQYDEPGFVQPIRGSFDVKEAFGELNAPLLKDVRFAQTLSIGAAGRYSRYSTIGSTNTWQVNGIYAPVRQVSFRGSYGYAVRAPNIGELFTPSAASTGYINDPCDLIRRGNGTQYRVANCTALLTGLGVNPATYAPDSGTTGSTDGDGTAFGEFRGNPNLKAEVARTWTAGVVLRPTSRLTLSADWYDIRLAGAISTPDLQTVANLCVDQPTLANPYCGLISRRQGTGKVNSFVVQPQNVSEYRTAGLDLNASYLIPTARLGTFDLRLVGGYLNRLDVVATPGAAVENQVDQIVIGAIKPRWTATFSPSWTYGPLTLGYTLRWFDRIRRYTKAETNADPMIAPANLLKFRAAWLSDLQAQVAVGKRFAVYGGVNNLTDQRPDEDSYDTPAPSLGRFLYIGAKMNLGR